MLALSGTALGDMNQFLDQRDIGWRKIIRQEIVRRLPGICVMDA
jgi:hypothetical protein